MEQNNILSVNNIKTELLSHDGISNRVKIENEFTVKELYSENTVNINNYVNNNSTEYLSSEISNGRIHLMVKTEDDIIVTECIKTEFKNKQLYCDQCCEVYEDYCTKCQMLIYILDKNTLTEKNNKKKEGIPKDILEVRESPGCFGIFTLKVIPEGVKFGPFTGLNISDCSWRLKGGKFVVREDQSRFPHWMYHINSVKSYLKHNLVAYQNKSKLYYRSICEIPKGEELLIYLGEEYLNSLEKDVEMNFIPTVEENDETVYACTFCCLGFNSKAYLIKHKSIYSNEADENSSITEIVQCSSCKIYLEEREYLDYHMDYCDKKNSRQHSSFLTDDRTMKIKRYTSVSNKHNKQKHKRQECSLRIYKTNGKDFRNRTGKHCNVEAYRCRICHRRFTLKRTLKAQYEEHLNVRDFNEKNSICANCKFETSYKCSSKNRLELSEKVERFKCSKCEFGTNNKSYLKKHVSAKHIEEKTQCKYKTNYKSHLNSIKRFKCPECDYRTVYKSNLNTHVNARHSEDKMKRFKCSECEYETNYNGNLKAHINLKHRKETVEQFQCAECEFKTSYRWSLKKHINTKHCEEIVKRFKCSECEYRTNNKWCLKTHVNARHSEQKVERFQCSECEYKTNYKSHMDRHINAKHSEEKVKRFKCPHCDHKTNNKSDLKLHVNAKHSKEKIKPFKCPLCEYQTNYQSCLKQHANAKHCDEKRFKCTECEYKTKCKSLLSTHVNAKHFTVKRFKCPKCVFETSYQSCLIRHVNEKNCKKKI